MKKQNRFLQGILHLCACYVPFICSNVIYDVTMTADVKERIANKAKPNKGMKKSVRISDVNANVDDGSVQRKRTAWVTSLGHQRVSLAELNNRLTFIVFIIIYCMFS